MKRVLTIALPILAIIALIHIARAPYRTVDELETALLTSDRDKLEATVDFAKLRQNLKDQLNAVIAGELSNSNDSSGLNLITADWASKMIDNLIDSFVTPEAIVNMTQGRTPADSTNSEDKHESLFKDAEFGYESISRFVVTTEENGQTTDFVFERYGLDWKLTKIIFPTQTLSSSTQAPGNNQ